MASNDLFRRSNTIDRILAVSSQLSQFPWLILWIKHFSMAVIILWLSSPWLLIAHHDPEEIVQDFMLKTKRILIPEYPYAFNPSIVRWNGSLLLSFRTLLDSPEKSQIGLIRVDHKFNQLNKPQLLDLGMAPLFTAEDARLLTVGNDLYLVYTDNIRMYLALLDFNGERFFIKHQENLFYAEGDTLRQEKNWVPFDYKGRFLMAYSLSPHRIIYPRIGKGGCKTMGLSHPQISWNWGELKGGTPGILIDHQYYLAIFHSTIKMTTVHSNGQEILHYFMGAYTFAKKPPFAITHISPMPLVAKGFYSGKIYTPYWRPLHVVFPCGLLDDGSYLWITYGRQDHEIWVAKVDKRRLLDSLVPVTSNDHHLHNLLMK